MSLKDAEDVRPVIGKQRVWLVQYKWHDQRVTSSVHGSEESARRFARQGDTILCHGVWDLFDGDVSS